VPACHCCRAQVDGKEGLARRKLDGHSGAVTAVLAVEKLVCGHTGSSSTTTTVRARAHAVYPC
jgi:hypothetical protein